MNRSFLNSILNWSVRVGRLWDIPIDLHITLLFFLLPLLSRSGLSFGLGLEYAVLIVLSILGHELGHALVAKRFRLRGLSIMLHGFGGFAMSSGNRTPNQSITISLAGPAVTFVIGFLSLGLGTLLIHAGDPYYQGWMFHVLGITNLILGVLNLLPMLPLDGGQTLEAQLSKKMTAFKAMRAVGHLGLILGPIIAIAGYIKGWDFIALFGIIGIFGSLSALLQTGGIRFGEFAKDRKHAKEMEAVRLRAKARNDAYMGEVDDRKRERNEKERLRKFLESSGIDGE